MEVVKARDAGKGIVFMFDRIREALRGAAQEVRRRFMVIERHDQRKRIDKHAEGVAETDVASAVRDGDDGNGILADVPAERQVAGGKIDRCRHDAAVLRKPSYHGDIGRNGNTLFGMGQVLFKDVGNQAGRLLDVCHLLCEEVLQLRRQLLLRGVVIIGIALRFRFLAVKCFAEAPEEQIHRRAVADQMMHFDQQVQSVGTDDLKPDAGTAVQVKGAHKFVLISRKIRSGHLFDGNLRGAVGNRFLHDFVVAVRDKTAKDVRVRADDPPDSVFELFFADTVGEFHDKRDVIANGFGTCLTFGVNALLGKAETAGLLGRLLCCLRLLLRVAAGHPYG